MKRIGTQNRRNSRVAKSDRPYVVVNMAMTADGKIATANRAVSSFGSKSDQDHLLELRATADAVMAGARTVDTNPIDMGPGGIKYRRKRLRNGRQEYNLRIIVSRSGSLDPGAHIFKKRFSPVLVLTTKQAGAARIAGLRAVATAVHVCDKAQINFTRALSWLKDRWKVQSLICEGGGELNSAMFREGLVDEIHLTICPYVFGGREAPTIADGTGLAKLTSAAQYELKSLQRVGREVLLRFSRGSPTSKGCRA